MTPTQTLHSLLTRLGAAPEWLRRDRSTAWYHSGVHITPTAAHAILCDAASELIESHGLNTGPGVIKMWALFKPRGGCCSTLSEHDTRTDALIAGLEWIVERQK